MYDVRLAATDDADWAVRIDLIDDDTHGPLDTTDLEIRMEVSRCGSTYLSASTEDGTIEIPQVGTAQWVFTKDQMGSLCPGETYDVGVTITNGGGTIQLLVGQLAFLNGGFSG